MRRIQTNKHVSTPLSPKMIYIYICINIYIYTRVCVRVCECVCAIEKMMRRELSTRVFVTNNFFKNYYFYPRPFLCFYFLFVIFPQWFPSFPLPSFSFFVFFLFLRLLYSLTADTRKRKHERENKWKKRKKNKNKKTIRRIAIVVANNEKFSSTYTIPRRNA